MIRFATAEDIEHCRALHQKFGTTYYYASLRFPPDVQRWVHSIYGFVREPDEWVDNPDGLDLDARTTLLREWRADYHRGLAGERPENAAVRAYCDVVRECRIPATEADLFLDAMEMDLTKTQYETFDELQRYMRGSASAIGVMMCYVVGAPTDADTIARACALGEAMQLTNFLRDIGEDLHRGRIYLPQEDLSRFGLTNTDIEARRVSPNFVELLRYEIERARKLYDYSTSGIARLPTQVRRSVLMARLLYGQILDRIEANNYDVFATRARTNRYQKALCAAKVGLAPKRTLSRLLVPRADAVP